MKLLRSSAHSYIKLNSKYMRLDISLELFMLHLPNKCNITDLIYTFMIPIHLLSHVLHSTHPLNFDNYKNKHKQCLSVVSQIQQYFFPMVW